MSCWTSTVPEAVSCSTFCGAGVTTLCAMAVPATARAAQAASNLIFFKTKYSPGWYERQAEPFAGSSAGPADAQRRWLIGASGTAGAVSGRAAVGGAGAIRSAGCDSAELSNAPAAGGVHSAAHLLAQLEQLGGRQAPAGGGLFAPHFLALCRPVGRHGVADFAAAHLPHPQVITGHRQRWRAGENKEERQGRKRMSH